MGTLQQTVTNTSPETAVRRAWLDHVVEESQRVAGRVPTIERERARDLLTQFVNALPAPSTHVEWVLMRSMLLDVAYRCGTALHERAHGGARSACGFDAAGLLDRFWKASGPQSEDAFLAWLDAFFAALDRTHPPSIAYRVSRLLAADFSRAWNLAVLAQRFNVTPASLRRRFKLEFGISTREYQRLLRLAAASMTCAMKRST